jgi:hypothetical protein
MHTGQLLYAAIEQHEVVQQLDQPLLGADLQQVFIQLEAAVVGLIFFPFQTITRFWVTLSGWPMVISSIPQYF